MTKLVFHHDPQLLPADDNDLLPVQLYGLGGDRRGDVSVIGNPIIDRIKRLGIELPVQVMDFLTISLAVTSADTFVRREDSDDGWAREFSIKLPLNDPDRWDAIKKELQSALHFLSGDIWSFDFEKGGYPPPAPYLAKNRYKLLNLKDLDCVCLFSGGLDSAIGVVDLIEENRKPLLISHGYTFDQGQQDKVASYLNGKFERLVLNADPHSAVGPHDVTMRTRSFNFLAFGVVGAYAVQEVNQLNYVDFFVPENGFISLNAPLTNRRVGSLSTRTTHPHFLEAIQKIFDYVGINCKIKNPYQFKTKGEMVKACKNPKALRNAVSDSVSCSHWKRPPHKQCGVCVPCIIRRASLHAGAVSETTDYQFNNVADVYNFDDRRDDLIALSIALATKSTRKIGAWISNGGPLPGSDYKEFQKVFINGLDEVEAFLNAEGAL